MIWTKDPTSYDWWEVEITFRYGACRLFDTNVWSCCIKACKKFLLRKIFRMRIVLDADLDIWYINYFFSMRLRISNVSFRYGTTGNGENTFFRVTGRGRIGADGLAFWYTLAQVGAFRKCTFRLYSKLPVGNDKLPARSWYQWRCMECSDLEIFLSDPDPLICNAEFWIQIR